MVTHTDSLNPTGCPKTAELIDMLFGGHTPMSLANRVLDARAH